MLAIREPAVALVIIGVALIIGVVAASGPLFSASTGSAALALEMSQQCAPDLGPMAIGGGPLDDVDRTNATLSALSSRLLHASGAPAYALVPPVVTVASQISVGRTARVGAPAQLVSRGGGLGQIDPIASAGGPGVWISGDLASEVHVRAGGHLFIATSDADGGVGAKRTAVRVSGIYRSLVGTVLPPFWCSLQSIFGTPDENAPPAPVILTTGAQFSGIMRQTGETSLDYYRWERPPSSTIGLQDGFDTAAAIAGFEHRLGIPASRPRQPQHRLASGFSVFDDDPDQYGFLVAHAQAVQTAVSQGVNPEVLAGVVVGLLLLGSASVFWVYRRRTEVRLLLSRGAAPGSIGIKAGLEAAPLMGIGAVLGWGGSVALLALVGPSNDFGSRALLKSALFAAAADVLALLLLAGIAALVTAGRTRPGRFRLPNLSKVPFELVGIGLSIWLFLSIQNVSLEAGGTSAPAVQSAFVIMPLLLLVSVSILFARVASIALGRARQLRLEGRVPLSGWLAIRRLAAAPGLAMLLVGSVALAAGAFTYAGAMARSQQYTLSAKAQTFVGSNVSLTVPQLVRLPRALAGNSTEVLYETSGTIGGSPAIVLGVNPSTFEKGGFWDSSFSGQSLGQLMEALAAAPSSRHVLPVIVAGPTNVSLKPGVLLPYSTPAIARRVHVVGTASTFPGQNGQDPILITTQTELARLDPAAQDEVWSKASEIEAISALRRSGVGSTSVVSATTALGQIEFAPLHWTFEALQALGLLVGILAFAGLFLFLTARSRARALSYALGLKMGLTRRTHVTSLALEIGLLFGSALALGIATAWFTTWLVDGLLNPLPELPPGPLLVAPWVNIALTVIVATAGWLLATWWAQHVTEKRSVAGVFRYDVD